MILGDGSAVHVSGLMVPAPHRQRRPELIDQLGLATSPTGHVVADPFGATSVAGVWAVGDLVSPFSNVAGAIAGGSAAAAAITRDLVMIDHGRDGS